MNYLIDIIPATARKYVYAVLSAGLAVFSLWEANQGDWKAFGINLAGAIVAVMATANTDVEVETE